MPDEAPASDADSPDDDANRSADSASEEEISWWPPEVAPSNWPAIYVRGLTLIRCEVALADQDDPEVDEGVTWEVDPAFIQPSSDDGSVLFAVAGTLSVRESLPYGRCMVAALMVTRASETEGADRPLETLFERYGLWAAGMLYDFASAHMRAMLASSAYGLEVPIRTPMPVLGALSSDSENDELASDPD